MTSKLITKARRIVGSGCGSVKEWTPPTPEIRGSNPAIGKYFFCQLCGTTNIKKKRSGISHFKKIPTNLECIDIEYKIFVNQNRNRQFCDAQTVEILKNYFPYRKILTAF